MKFIRGFSHVRKKVFQILDRKSEINIYQKIILGTNPKVIFRISG